MQVLIHLRHRNMYTSFIVIIMASSTSHGVILFSKNNYISKHGYDLLSLLSCIYLLLNYWLHDGLNKINFKYQENSGTTHENTLIISLNYSLIRSHFFFWWFELKFKKYPEFQRLWTLYLENQWLSQALCLL